MPTTPPIPAGRVLDQQVDELERVGRRLVLLADQLRRTTVRIRVTTTPED